MRFLLFGSSIVSLVQPSVSFGFGFMNHKSLSRLSRPSSSLSLFVNHPKSNNNNNNNNNNSIQQLKMTMIQVETIPKRSLALDFVINIINDSEWRLVPIDTVSSSPLVGTMALQALEGTDKSNDDDDIVLTCHVNHQDGQTHISITSTTSENNERFISTLARIMVQSTISTIIMKENATTDMMTISFPGETNNIVIIANMESYSPSMLFQDVLEGGDDGFEMNELVTQNGECIGHVPRPLVHEFNLLHSGIGIIVLDDVGKQLLPKSVYVHRRTDTKRIFPSLYDMFVGGVCTAGEGLRDTALREIQEELGLVRTTALSLSPHLTCTVCTSYNRCIVALYSYQYDPTLDSVSWQKEEVAWGELVPYPTVVQTAKASIQRYQKRQTWPGGKKDTTTLLEEDDETMENNIDNVPEWDYVPDGLLVWEAWLEWLQTIQVPEKLAS